MPLEAPSDAAATAEAVTEEDLPYPPGAGPVEDGVEGRDSFLGADSPRSERSEEDEAQREEDERRLEKGRERFGSISEEIKALESGLISEPSTVAEDDNRKPCQHCGRKFLPERLARHVKVCEDLKRGCLLYTSPSPRDKRQSRMPSSA